MNADLLVITIAFVAGIVADHWGIPAVVAWVKVKFQTPAAVVVVPAAAAPIPVVVVPAKPATPTAA